MYNKCVGVAFSGWADPYAALQDSAGIMWQLPGTKYISLGGGNSNGRFTQSVLDAARDAIYANAFAGYDGIVYDIEEGDAGLTNAFTSNFAAAKSMGYRVLVTVSHSAPYGISDAASLMRSFFTDNNIDYLSPQLYTSGTETWNDYTTVAGVEWWEYGSAKAAVVPSVSYSYLYGDAEGYFQSQGVSTIGYVQWSQSG